MSVTIYALFYRSPIFYVLRQFLNSSQLVIHPFNPTVLFLRFPWPPMFVIGISIEDTISGNSNIFLTISINQRRVVHTLHSFPTRLHQRLIVCHIPAEQ